jgi:hypothetical protein
MITLLRKKRLPTTVLGLALNGSRLEGAVARRSNGSVQAQKTFIAALALNPLTADPELVGREIRNHLEQAGIRERRCVVCLPSSWALVLQTEMPDLPEEDVGSFLQIEAERGFHYGSDAISTASSRCRSSTGKQFASQVAIPRNHLSQLEKVLKAAQLRPIGFTLGIAALQSPEKESSHGVLALLVGESSVDLQVTCGGGILLLRTLDGVFEAEGVQQRLSPELLLREIKITLGQLPSEFRDAVRKVHVFGNAETARRYASQITARAEAMGLTVEFVESYLPNEFSKSLPAGTEVSPAFSAAARSVTGARPVFDFLPSKVRPWQQLTTRFSSRKLVWAGGTAGAAVLLVAAVFLAQQWQLSRLQTRWARMEPKVRELEEMQQQIKRFRPWFDESVRSLTILRKITEAFPEDGVVSAKTLEIRELASVTCSGVARDNQALLKVLDQLRATKEIGSLKVDQIRGKTPLQFTFNFHWGEGGGDAN